MLRKFFSCCLVGLFIPLFLISVFFGALKGTLFDATFIKSALKKTNIYQRLVDQGLPVLLKKSAHEQKNAPWGPLTPEDLQKIVRGSVTAPWLRTQTENIIDGTFRYLTKKTSTPNIVISLAEVKNSLSNNLVKRMEEAWVALPTCTISQLEQMQTKKGSQTAASCKPPGMSFEQVASQITSGKDGFLTQIPQEYDLGQALAQNAAGLAPLRVFLGSFETIAWGVLIASIFLLVLVFLINLSYFPGALKWVSMPALIVSGVILVFALVTNSLFAKSLSSHWSPQMPQELLTIVSDAATAIVGPFYVRLEVYSGVVFLIALLLLVLAKILAKKLPKAKATNAH